jgi:hypothetical protein
MVVLQRHMYNDERLEFGKPFGDFLAACKGMTRRVPISVDEVVKFRTWVDGDLKGNSWLSPVVTVDRPRVGDTRDVLSTSQSEFPV